MTGTQSHAYEFGDFRLYPEEALLLRFHEPVPLAPKAFKLLCILVEQRGHLLDKQELMKAVWPDTYVLESNLTYNISLLRKLFSESGGADWIVTTPKRGYRFVAPTREIGSAPGGANEAEVAAQSPEVPHPAIETPLPSGRWKAGLLYGLPLLGIATVCAFLFGARFSIQANKPQISTVALSRQAMLSDNDEANEYFERGIHVLERRSNVSGPKGVEALEHAVAKDPEFAVAYAHLAIAYFMSGDPLSADKAAATAIRLNPSLPEAHAASAFISMYRDWDWNKSEHELRQAIALDDRYARGHHWLAIWLQIQGRLSEADLEMRRALELDRVSPVINSDLCELLYSERNYSAAAVQCRKTIDLDPDFVASYARLESIYFMQGQFDLAAATAIERTLKEGHDSQTPGMLRDAYARSGIRGLTQIELDVRLKWTPQPGYTAARYYAKLGENDRALQALLSSYQAHDFFLPYVKSDPLFDPIRSDPRYIELLKKIGLPV